MPDVSSKPQTPTPPPTAVSTVQNTFWWYKYLLSTNYNIDHVHGGSDG